MEDIVTPEDVEQEINFIESLLSQTNSADDYLSALLRSNNAILRVLKQQSMGGQEFSRTPPADSAGIAVDDAVQGDVVSFLYKNQGRTVVAKVRAARQLDSGDVAKYDANQNGLIPVSDVEQGDLDFGAISAALSSASGFAFADTDFYNDGSNVTIAPGEKKAVLRSTFNAEVGLYEVGTVDKTYSSYQYSIDGESLLDGPVPKPLGLYNSRFEFPKPLRVVSEFEVEVTRSPDAPGSAEYFSNAVFQ